MMKRVYVDIPEGIHKELKMTALKNNQTLKGYIEKILVERGIVNAQKENRKKGK